MSNTKPQDASPHTTDAGHNNNNNNNLIPILLHPYDLQDLPNALRTHGAAYILNPPVPQAPLATAREHLFSLSQSKKNTLKHPNGSTVRGYSAHLPSGREWWDYTPEKNVKDRLLPDSDVFVTETEQYFQSVINYMGSLISILRETWTEIPEEASTFGLSTIRYLRYSPALIESKSESETTKDENTQNIKRENAKSNAQEPAKEGKWWKRGKRGSIDKNTQAAAATTTQSLNLSRMQTHTDHGILTLMTSTPLPSTNPIPNLYIYTPNEQPLPAPPIPNTILVIAGDCLGHWTHGDIVPTAHEVLVTEGERVSCAVFLRPGNDVVLSRGREDGKVKVKVNVKGEGVGAGDDDNDDDKNYANNGENQISGEENTMTYKQWAAGKGVVKGRRCWLPRREAREKEKNELVKTKMQDGG